MKKFRKLMELFITFMKIGLFTFGGGYAMISVIENICVEKKKWITHDEMMNMTVIAESTPGPIAINCATYVGFTQGGFIGSVMTTIGVIIPSFVIIYVISLFLDSFMKITIIANAFKGIKVAVGILIISTAAGMIKKMKKSHLTVAILACSSLAVLCINIFSIKFSTIYLLLIAAFVSLMVYVIDQGIKKQKGSSNNGGNSK